MPPNQVPPWVGQVASAITGMVQQIVQQSGQTVTINTVMAKDGTTVTTVVLGNDGMFSMQGKADIGNIVRVGAMPEIGYAETSEQATEHVLRIAKT